MSLKKALPTVLKRAKTFLSSTTAHTQKILYFRLRSLPQLTSSDDKRKSLQKARCAETGPLPYRIAEEGKKNLLKCATFLSGENIHLITVTRCIKSVIFDTLLCSAEFFIIKVTLFECVCSLKIIPTRKKITHRINIQFHRQVYKGMTL